MEKIKSRWKRNYLEGDIINNDEAKDENCDSGDYNDAASSTKSNKIINNTTNNLTNASSTTTTSSNNSNHNNLDHHHHNHHHHPHLHNNINSNNTNNHDATNDSSKTNHHNHRYHHHKHHSNSNINGTSSSSSSKHSSTPPTYEAIEENLYLDKRKSDYHRNRKDARSMICDCILTKEERLRGVMGCLDDCLNRMLMIECGPKCSLGDHCLNKRFQKCQSAKVEMFKTKKKGWGLRTTTELPAGSFIMEYVGEVVRSKELRSRIKKYTKMKVKHHYFMALRSDEIIDATCKGNLTRFINHSCEPNCETQKWTVNGDLRIGFFTLKNLQPGDEITFDYQFQRYGRKAQKCYCEAPSCRGFIGGSEPTFSLNGHSISRESSESKARKKAFKHGLLVDITIEDKINALAEDAVDGLKTREQVLALATLSLKVEEVSDRRKLLNIIKATEDPCSLRLFVEYHGLEIICLWMRDPQADCGFKVTIIEILEKLERLPILTKTKVVDSQVYRWIEKWATEEHKPVVHTISEANSTENSNGTDERSRSNSDGHKDGDDDVESRGTRKVSILDENNDSQQATLPLTPTKEASSQDVTLPLQRNAKFPNIKMLADRLLRKFQALNQGFKIPRLNRQQRKELESTMQMQQNSADFDLKEKDKKPLDSNHPFKKNFLKPSTTNGLVNSTSQSVPIKRKFDTSSTNNIDLTPAPKISKEERRQQFEINVRMKDYYDNIERHYGSAIAEQVKMSHCAFSALNGFPLPFPNHLLASQNLFYLSAAAAASHPLAPIISPSLVVGQQQPPSHSPVQPSLPQPPPPPPMQQPSAFTPTVPLQPQSPAQSSSPLASQAQSTLPTTTTITEIPTLIVLANQFIEPSNRIDDELAFSVCDYDEYYTIRDRPLEAEDVINNEAYPYPGSYYTTPDGEKWFVTVALDRKTQQPKSVILNLNKLGIEARESSNQVSIKEEKPRNNNDPRNKTGSDNGASVRRTRQTLSTCETSALHKTETKLLRDRRLSRHTRVESAYPYKPGTRPGKSRVSTLHEIQQ